MFDYVPVTEGKGDILFLDADRGDARKPVIRVLDNARLKPVYLATETS